MDLLGADFAMFVAIGLCAQLVDGALGMAYGLVSSSILLAMGMPPAAVSASVHTPKCSPHGSPAPRHGAMGNVDRKLMLRWRCLGVVRGGGDRPPTRSADRRRRDQAWIHGYLLVLAR